MKSKPLSRPRSCLVSALELIGLDDPSFPAGRARQVLSDVLRAPSSLPWHDASVVLAGHRMIHLAPIKHKGMLVFDLLLDWSSLQERLFKEGVLMRGAVTIGEAASQEGAFFGLGVSTAERLRDEVTADLPRIIVDPIVFTAVEREPDLRTHAPMDELYFIRDQIRQDADGHWFIDYLWRISPDIIDNEYFDVVRRHRFLIERKLESTKVLDRSSRAITWLWRYHDLVLDEIKKKYPEIALPPDLRLPSHSPLVYRFPGIVEESR